MASAGRRQVAGLFLADRVIGKHELITYAAGINLEGSLRQFQILEYREAYGSQIRFPSWRDQFVGKTAADKVELDTDSQHHRCDDVVLPRHRRNQAAIGLLPSCLALT